VERFRERPTDAVKDLPTAKKVWEFSKKAVGLKDNELTRRKV
jgi:hypothetical protein